MKLRVNGKGSKCKESSANDRGSGRTQLRESSEEPKMAKSKAETESSRQTMPKTEATESCWANECGRGGRPGCKESKTNKTKPVLAELRRDDDKLRMREVKYQHGQVHMRRATNQRRRPQVQEVRRQ